jgi:hypothetical protein
VDNAWEQRKFEARKMLENAAESHLSSAPRNDGGRSFSTRERLATEAEKMQKTSIFQKKAHFFIFWVPF